MDTQVCTKCGEKKSVTEFSWRNKAANRKLESCKKCYNSFRRKYYLSHKDEERQRVYARRNIVKKKVMNYLSSHPCVDCEERDPIVLQFDHVRGKKMYNVSHMVRDTKSWESILKEISKCDIRCANCHTRKTAKDFRWTKFKGDQ